METEGSGMSPGRILPWRLGHRCPASSLISDFQPLKLRETTFVLM